MAALSQLGTPALQAPSLALSLRARAPPQPPSATGKVSMSLAPQSLASSFLAPSSASLVSSSLAPGRGPGLCQKRQQQRQGQQGQGQGRGQGQQRRRVGVRAAGFEGPERAEPETVVIKTLTAPSSWPGAESSIGPGHYEYLPFFVPFKMIMGIAPLDPDEWIQIDPFYKEEMKMKRWVLENRRDTALVSLPEAKECNRELLELLIDHLPKRFPKIFKVDGNLISNSLTGETFDYTSRAWDPLELSARLVQEDLCLMLPNEAGDEFRFVSGAVCFPMKWSLREKMGMTTEQIHVPVPLYHEKIVHQVDSFMSGLRVGRPYWRSNWNINDDPTLYRPLTEEQHEDAKEAALESAHRGGPETITVENAGERLFTRCERETFVRFPRTQAVLFTIRTFVKPLSIFQGRPELAAKCIRAMDQLPECVQRYKMLAPIKGVSRHYLARCSEGLVSEEEVLASANT